jgi:hypothetical protein
MKTHKEIPQLTLTEDDADLVEEKVQDRIAKAMYDVRSRGRK